MDLRFVLEREDLDLDDSLSIASERQKGMKGDFLVSPRKKRDKSLTTNLLQMQSPKD